MSLLTSLVSPVQTPTDAHIQEIADARLGLGQRTDTIEPVIDGRVVAATTTAAFASNGVYLYHFRLDRDFTVSKIAFYIAATTAGNVDFGIYTSADMATFTRAAHTGSVAAGSANTRTEYALTAPYDLDAGVNYWFGFGLTDGSLTIPRLGAINAILLGQKTGLVKASAWSSGLPDTLSGMAGHNATPWFALVA